MDYGKSMKRYLLERTKEFAIYDLSKKYPHILQHTEIKIRKADPLLDYYFPPELADKAVVIDWKFNSDGCAMTSCFPYYPRSKECKPNDTLKIFQSGNTRYFACQPICSKRNVLPISFNRWSDHMNKCFIENPEYFRWNIDDSTRAEEIVPWVTTIGTGFDANIEYNPEEQTERVKFFINKQYCEGIGLEFDEEQKKCYETTGRWLFSTLISETVWRVGQMGKDKINGFGPSDIRNPDLPTPINNVEPPDFLLSKKAWSKKRNSTFRMPDNILNLRCSNLGIGENEVWSSVAGSKLKPFERKVPHKMDLFEKILLNYIENPNDDNSPDPEPPKDDDSDSILSKINAILQSMFTIDSLKAIAMGASFDILLNFIKRQLKIKSAWVIPLMVKRLTVTGAKFTFPLLSLAAKFIGRKQLCAIVLNKLLVTLSSAAVKALSIIGVVLIVFTVVDLIMMFTDAFNTSQEITQEILNEMCENVYASNFKLYFDTNPEYSPLFYYFTVANAINNEAELEEKEYGENSHGLETFQIFDFQNSLEYMSHLPISKPYLSNLIRPTNPAGDNEKIPDKKKSGDAGSDAFRFYLSFFVFVLVSFTFMFFPFEKINLFITQRFFS